MRTGAYVVIGAFVASAGCIPASAVSARALHASSMRSVQYRAAFDLDCPVAEVEVRCLDVSAQSLERSAMCIAAGARGCGRRASYRTVVVPESGSNLRLVSWALEGIWDAPELGPRCGHGSAPSCYFAECRTEEETP